MKTSSSTYTKKAKRIRKAGKRTELEFFGKGGPLEYANSFREYVEEVYAIPWREYPKLTQSHKDNILHFYHLDRNRMKDNPITVVGLANPQENPPRSVNANIEGIVYNRCIEIRAEKTGYKKGYYKHPFSRGSQVCIYALDNGDLLVHSKAGVKLWQPD